MEYDGLGMYWIVLVFHGEGQPKNLCFIVSYFFQYFDESCDWLFGFLFDCCCNQDSMFTI